MAYNIKRRAYFRKYGKEYYKRNSLRVKAIALMGEAGKFIEINKATGDISDNYEIIKEQAKLDLKSNQIKNFINI